MIPDSSFLTLQSERITLSCTNSRLFTHPQPSPDAPRGPCDIWSRHCRSLGCAPFSDFAFSNLLRVVGRLASGCQQLNWAYLQHRHSSIMARFAQGPPAHLWIAVLLSLTYSCFTWFLRIYARVGYYGIDDVAITVAHVSVLYLKWVFHTNAADQPTVFVWHELPSR